MTAPLFTDESSAPKSVVYAHNSPFAKPGPYQTPLSGTEESLFRQWLAVGGVKFNPDDPQENYDMRGFWKAGGRPSAFFPDTYKTPWDTTFSAESKYATPNCPFVWRDEATLIDNRNNSVVFFNAEHYNSPSMGKQAGGQLSPGARIWRGGVPTMVPGFDTGGGIDSGAGGLDKPSLEKLGVTETGKGRWHYPYKGERPPSTEFGTPSQEWEIAPTDAPAREDAPYIGGRTQTWYFDPERARVESGLEDEFGPMRPRLSPNDPNAITDYRDLPTEPGKLYRGMSDDEYQNARERGYFESDKTYNIAGLNNPFQADKTFFSTSLHQSANYATDFAPWQYQPTFTKPGHVIAIPDRPDLPRGPLGTDPKSTEVGVPGRIPFDEVTDHWVANVAGIMPGEYSYRPGAYYDPREDVPYRTSSPKVSVQWERAEIPTATGGLDELVKPPEPGARIWREGRSFRVGKDTPGRGGPGAARPPQKPSVPEVLGKAGRVLGPAATAAGDIFTAYGLVGQAAEQGQQEQLAQGHVIAQGPSVLGIPTGTAFSDPTFKGGQSAAGRSPADMAYWLKHGKWPEQDRPQTRSGPTLPANPGLQSGGQLQLHNTFRVQHANGTVTRHELKQTGPKSYESGGRVKLRPGDQILLDGEH